MEQAEAKEGAKFVIVDIKLTNTTNKTFSFPPDLSLSIKETGYLVYEIPTDAMSYFLVVGKSGTNELYKIILK